MASPRGLILVRRIVDDFLHVCRPEMYIFVVDLNCIYNKTPQASLFRLFEEGSTVVFVLSEACLRQGYFSTASTGVIVTIALYGRTTESYLEWPKN